MRLTKPQPRWRSEPECVRTRLECPQPVGAHVVVTVESRVSCNGRKCCQFCPFRVPFPRPFSELSISSTKPNVITVPSFVLIASFSELSVSSTKPNEITISFLSRPRWPTFKNWLLRSFVHRVLMFRIQIGWSRIFHQMPGNGICTNVGLQTCSPEC